MRARRRRKVMVLGCQLHSAPVPQGTPAQTRENSRSKASCSRCRRLLTMQQLSLFNVRTHFTKGGDVYVAWCMTCTLQLDEWPFSWLSPRRRAYEREAKLLTQFRRAVGIAGKWCDWRNEWGRLRVEYAASQAHGAALNDK